jgi:2-polyprenyl-3-methyl-5-hydroxy-6-metoxy-1,4-benzoquinol methylase
MMPDDAHLAEGTYARKQLFGGCSLLSWSHGRRFETALQLAAPFAGRPMLDYGCGDGTLLAMAGDRFPRSVGLEVDAALVESCRARFGETTHAQFLMAHEADALPSGAFGVVLCTEVLEHCPPEAAAVVLQRMHRLVARDGRVLISVPVETGLPLVVKQTVRAIAGRRVSSDYRQREHYTAGEFVRMLTAGDGAPVDRPVYETRFADGTPNRYHGHKGFNWRAMRLRVGELFEVRETRFSPVAWLGPQLASQAWFICAPK